MLRGIRANKMRAIENSVRKAEIVRSGHVPNHPAAILLLLRRGIERRGFLFFGAVCTPRPKARVCFHTRTCARESVV